MCLDPSPVVSLVARKAASSRQKYSTLSLKRSAKKFSQVGINRKRKLEAAGGANPEVGHLLDFTAKIQKRTKKATPQVKHKLIEIEQCIDERNLSSSNASPRRRNKII